MNEPTPIPTYLRIVSVDSEIPPEEIIDDILVAESISCYIVCTLIKTIN